MCSVIVVPKKNLLFLAWLMSVIIPVSMFGQSTFFKTFDQSPFGRPYLSIQTTDSNYVISGAGVSQLPGELPSIIKLNSFGDSIWIKKVITPDTIAFDLHQFNPTSLIACNDSGMIYVDRNGYIVKIKKDGTIHWARKLSINNSNVDYPYSTGDNNDGLYFIVNSIDINSNPVKIVGHVNNFGNLTHAYSISNLNFYTTSINLINSNSLVITGMDVIISYNFNSNSFNWIRQFSELQINKTSKIGMNGDFIMIGHSEVTGPVGNIIVPIVNRMDSNGNISWSKRFGDNFSQVVQSMKETNDGGMIFGGYTSNFGALSSAEDFYSFKLDSNGSLAWTRVFGGESSDKIYGIEPTNSEDYYVVGSTESYLCISKTSFSRIDPSVIDCWYLGLNSYTQNLALNPQSITAQSQAIYNVNLNAALVSLEDMTLGQNLELCPRSCNEVGQESLNEPIVISIFPNPSNGEIRIKGLNSEIIQYSIYNSLGQFIKAQNVKANSIIDVRELSSGIYSIRVTDNTSVYTTSFLKD